MFPTLTIDEKFASKMKRELSQRNRGRFVASHRNGRGRVTPQGAPPPHDPRCWGQPNYTGCTASNGEPGYCLNGTCTPYT